MKIIFIIIKVNNNNIWNNPRIKFKEKNNSGNLQSSVVTKTIWYLIFVMCWRKKLLVFKRVSN